MGAKGCRRVPGRFGTSEQTRSKHRTVRIWRGCRPSIICASRDDRRPVREHLLLCHAVRMLASVHVGRHGGELPDEYLGEALMASGVEHGGSGQSGRVTGTGGSPGHAHSRRASHRRRATSNAHAPAITSATPPDRPDRDDQTVAPPPAPGHPRLRSAAAVLAAAVLPEAGVRGSRLSSEPTGLWCHHCEMSYMSN